jgi:hypothetical protein
MLWLKSIRSFRNIRPQCSAGPGGTLCWCDAPVGRGSKALMLCVFQHMYMMVVLQQSLGWLGPRMRMLSGQGICRSSGCNMCCKLRQFLQHRVVEVSSSKWLDTCKLWWTMLPFSLLTSQAVVFVCRSCSSSGCSSSDGSQDDDQGFPGRQQQQQRPGTADLRDPTAAAAAATATATAARSSSAGRSGMQSAGSAGQPWK